MSKNVHIWTFDVNDITQNNSYVQLLVPLCVFLPLLCDLRQTYTKCSMKPAVVLDWAVQGIISS